MNYERDCILCPLSERRLKYLAVIFSLMSTSVVLVHVMIFTVTSVANGCICGFAGCPATPLALFGQGLWCGAFGFIAATLAIFASHSRRKSFKCAFGLVVVFNTFFHSCGALIDGYGALSLYQCVTCRTFQDAVTTSIFVFLVAEGLLLVAIGCMSFVSSIYAIQWAVTTDEILSLTCLAAPHSFESSVDSIERTEWILPERRNYVPPTPPQPMERRYDARTYEDCWHQYAEHHTLPHHWYYFHSARETINYTKT